MTRQRRIRLLRRLGKALGAELISCFTGDRQALATQIGEDSVLLFREHLGRIGEVPILVGWLPAGTPAIRIPPPPATEKGHEAKRVFHPSPADTEQKDWLKVAESAFAFWDNPDDDGWDQL